MERMERSIGANGYKGKREGYRDCDTCEGVGMLESIGRNIVTGARTVSYVVCKDCERRRAREQARFTTVWEGHYGTSAP